MHVVSNLQWVDKPFSQEGRYFAKGRRMVAALDLEWTKNYSIRNGSRPFCYSISIIEVPNETVSVATHPISFGFKSVYVENPDEEGTLLRRLDDDLADLRASETVMCGHQLSSDLSVALAASSEDLDNVSALYDSWRVRKSEYRVIDTRYDVDSLVRTKSRRLVDVATELGLDVTQPELGRSSLTALHRRYIETGEELVRERLTIMNLRHSLSTALLGAMVNGSLTPSPRNLNTLILDTAWDLFDYLQTDEFASLAAVKPA